MEEKIELVRIFLAEENLASSFWTNEMIMKCLNLSEIFQILSAVKLLKIMDNEDWEIPDFEEIVEKIKEFSSKKEVVKLMENSQ